MGKIKDYLTERQDRGRLNDVGKGAWAYKKKEVKNKKDK